MDKQTAYKRGIIKQLFFNGRLSSSELSLLTDKSIPLVNRLLGELVDEGSITENGYASSTGGRRPLVYALRADLMFVVSVAMDQLFTRLAIVNMHNNIQGPVQEVELRLQENPDAHDRLAHCIRQFIRARKLPLQKIVGIGIGMPGFVDVTKGVNHSFFQGAPQNIGHWLEHQLQVPVFIDNDSSLIALAEQRLGAARHIQNAMVVNINWGVGLGMILKGELFRGNNGFAGEFSHIPLFTNNKLCSCGKTGCLETQSSMYYVAERAMEGIAQGRMTAMNDLSLQRIEETTGKIVAAALNGDRFAIELFSEAAYNVGRGVAILIHLLNPEMIVLSGRGAVAGKFWLTPMQQAINEHCIPKIAADTQVIPSPLGHMAGLLGAAALVMEHYPAMATVKPSMLTTG